MFAATATRSATPCDSGRRAPDDGDIKRLAARDRGLAMGLIVRKYHTPLHLRATSILKDPQEAQDLLQEVFIRAMREPRLFLPEFELRAWLYRVTTNLCFNNVRDKRRRATLLSGLPEEALPQGRPSQSAELVFTEELRDSLLLAMDRLTPEHREILMLRYYGDLSYAEIAERLDIKLGTVMSRLSRARSRLTDVVGPDHPLAAVAA